MTDGVVDVVSTVEGTVSAIVREVGDEVAAGTTVAVVELMKMERPVVAADAGTLVAVLVGPGDEVTSGTVVARVDTLDAGWAATASTPASGERPDLERLRARRHLTTDAARPDAVAQRHGEGSRTARENVGDLLDPGSFIEYGALAHAAQRQRRDADELRARTPADGIVTGLGTVGAHDHDVDEAEVARRPDGDGDGDGEGEGDGDGELAGGRRGDAAGQQGADAPEDATVVAARAAATNGHPWATVAVAAYDYTVLAGTQGHTSHAKLDRILAVAHDLAVPLVLFAEGGGGRPGDTDVLQGAWLGVPTFRLLAQLSATAPTVAVCHGYAFAGNAALAGVCDVVVATRDAVVGMAGPAMVAGGRLGDFAPDQLGPVAQHARTGAVDVVVDDEQAATATARAVIRLLRGDTVAVPLDVQRERAVGERLRDLVPLDRKRPHDAGALLAMVADRGSLVELRHDAAPGMRTALARIHGRPVGLLANDPEHLAGAIDSAGAESAAQLLELCDVRGLPVVSLVDTPGFMVGPDSDAEGAFRRTGRLYRAGARLRTPLVAVVVRRAFGLGAMAMTGGDLRAPLATFTWPSAELGPMGLEGAVRLGARRELDAIEDEHRREARVDELVEEMRERSSALNVATFAEVDDVIDPADTRSRIAAVLAAAGHSARRR